jgi:hypothetical protein
MSGCRGDVEHRRVGPYVIVGCEGYDVVAPSLVGIAVPNWQPTDLATALPDPAGSSASGWMESLANANENGDVAILRERHGGVSRPLTLTELRRRQRERTTMS